MKYLKIMIKNIIIFLFLPILFLGCLERKLEITSFQGNKINISMEKNTNSPKVFLIDENTSLIINFFTSTCSSCIEEIQAFNELSKEMPEKIKIIGILGEKLTDEKIKKMINEYKINYDIITDVKTISTLSKAVDGIFGVPATFVFDKHGRQIDKFLGYVPKSTIKSSLQKSF